MNSLSLCSTSMPWSSLRSTPAHLIRCFTTSFRGNVTIVAVYFQLPMHTSNFAIDEHMVCLVTTDRACCDLGFCRGRMPDYMVELETMWLQVRSTSLNHKTTSVPHYYYSSGSPTSWEYGHKFLMSDVIQALKLHYQVHRIFNMWSQKSQKFIKHFMY